MVTIPDVFCVVTNPKLILSASLAHRLAEPPSIDRIIWTNDCASMLTVLPVDRLRMAAIMLTDDTLDVRLIFMVEVAATVDALAIDANLGILKATEVVTFETPDIVANLGIVKDGEAVTVETLDIAAVRNMLITATAETVESLEIATDRGIVIDVTAEIVDALAIETARLMVRDAANVTVERLSIVADLGMIRDATTATFDALSIAIEREIVRDATTATFDALPIDAERPMTMGPPLPSGSEASGENPSMFFYSGFSGHSTEYGKPV